MTFEEMFENKKNGICPFCGKDVKIEELRDNKSREEFQISGLCQSCQDDVFGR